MRLFEFQPGEAMGRNLSVFHLDLDHVVSMRDVCSENGSGWWVELSNNQNFYVTEACFQRMMRAWESK